MTRTGLAVALMLPVVLVACQKTPPPPPAAGADRAGGRPARRAAPRRRASTSSTVTVTPASSTKTGETIYSVVANGVGYNCVVGPDGTIASFTPQ